MRAGTGGGALQLLLCFLGSCWVLHPPWLALVPQPPVGPSFQQHQEKGISAGGQQEGLTPPAPKGAIQHGSVPVLLATRVAAVVILSPFTWG